MNPQAKRLKAASHDDPAEVALLIARRKLAVYQFTLHHLLSELLSAAVLARKGFGHHIEPALGIHILKAH